METTRRRRGSNERGREDRQEARGLDALANQFYIGQPVWPVISCNGKEKLGARRTVTRIVNGRVFASAPGQKEVDYHPNKLSKRAPQ